MGENDNVGAAGSNTVPDSGSMPASDVVSNANSQPSQATNSKIKGKIIIASAVIIVLAVAVTVFLSISHNAATPRAATSTTQSTITTIATATTTIPQVGNHTYIETIYYFGSNITIYPGSSASVSFTVPQNMPSAILTGAFTVKGADVEASVLNATEYAAFEAKPSSITSSRNYLGYVNSKNISINLTPGTYSVTFFNTNATPGAQYNIMITKSIALYT